MNEDAQANISDLPGAEAPGSVGGEQEGFENIFDEFEQPEADELFGDVFGADTFDDGAASAPLQGDWLEDLGLDGADPAGLQSVSSSRDETHSQVGKPTPGRPLPPGLEVRKKQRHAGLEAASGQRKAPSTPLPDAITDRWQAVMDAIKVKQPLKIKETDAQTFSTDMIQEMKEAAEADLELFKQGKPMLRKMQMLPKAVDAMRKWAFANYFVSQGGCLALAMWLRTLPNGMLPNVHLRTALLACMMRLPISKEALLDCKELSLGALVAGLRTNPSETVENRKTASLLVNKWVKQVLMQKHENFEIDAMADDENDAAKPKLPRKPAETLDSFLAFEEEAFKRMHPRIPFPEGHEYGIQPVPIAQPMRRDKVNVESNRGKLNEVMKVLTRPNKKCWKPTFVSVAGRTVNAL